MFTAERIPKIKMFSLGIFVISALIRLANKNSEPLFVHLFYFLSFRSTPDFNITAVK